MNNSILYGSFKYQRSNFDLLIKLSPIIYEVLCQELYTDDKLTTSLLNNSDFNISESIIKHVKVPEILHEYLVSCCLDNNIRLAKLLLRYITDIHYNNNHALSAACLAANIELAKILIANGADIHFNDDYFITQRYRYYSYNVLKFFLESGIDANKHRDFFLREVLDMSPEKIDLLKTLLRFNLEII